MTRYMLFRTTCLAGYFAGGLTVCLTGLFASSAWAEDFKILLQSPDASVSIKTAGGQQQVLQSSVPSNPDMDPDFLALLSRANELAARPKVDADPPPSNVFSFVQSREVFEKPSTGNYGDQFSKTPQQAGNSAAPASTTTSGVPNQSAPPPAQTPATALSAVPASAQTSQPPQSGTPNLGSKLDSDLVLPNLGNQTNSGPAVDTGLSPSNRLRIDQGRLEMGKPAATTYGDQFNKASQLIGGDTASQPGPSRSGAPSVSSPPVMEISLQVPAQTTICTTSDCVRIEQATTAVVRQPANSVKEMLNSVKLDNGTPRPVALSVSANGGRSVTMTVPPKPPVATTVTGSATSATATQPRMQGQPQARVQAVLPPSQVTLPPAVMMTARPQVSSPTAAVAPP